MDPARTNKGVLRARSPARWWAIAAALSAAAACSQTTRHRILTTLFDGVPPLESDQPAEVRPEPAPERGEDAAGGLRNPAAVRIEEGPRIHFHEPYKNHQCTACHDMARLVTIDREDRNLCLKCHGAQFKGEWVHGPVAAGACLLCHHPHKSEFPHLLLTPSSRMCQNCHAIEELLPGPHHDDLGARSRAESADPSTRSVCLECHLPHVSDKRYLLR